MELAPGRRSGSAALMSLRRRRAEEAQAELTGVGHELERAAEFPVAGRRASADVEDVGSERGEALDVGVPRRRFDDPVAPFVLILRTKRQ